MPSGGSTTTTTTIGGVTTAAALSSSFVGGCGSKNGLKVKGEGRVISLNAKYGFLSAQGINSKVFIIPSSLKVEAPFPPLTDELQIDDLVSFEAIEQAERNGARYLAIDGSVKLKQRGKDVMVEGDGKIVRLDAVRGCFGFVDAPKVGSVFFNISAVRPATTDVTKVFKNGQKVKFRALPNSDQPNCKWRASIVCAYNKASEYLPLLNSTTTQRHCLPSASHLPGIGTVKHYSQDEAFSILKKSQSRSDSTDGSLNNSTSFSTSPHLQNSVETLNRINSSPAPSSKQELYDNTIDNLTSLRQCSTPRSNLADGFPGSCYNNTSDSQASISINNNNNNNNNHNNNNVDDMDVSSPISVGSKPADNTARKSSLDNLSSKFNETKCSKIVDSRHLSIDNFNESLPHPTAVLYSSLVTSSANRKSVWNNNNNNCNDNSNTNNVATSPSSTFWPQNGSTSTWDVDAAALWDSYLEQQQKALSSTALNESSQFLCMTGHSSLSGRNGSSGSYCSRAYGQDFYLDSPKYPSVFSPNLPKSSLDNDYGMLIDPPLPFDCLVTSSNSGLPVLDPSLDHRFKSNDSALRLQRPPKSSDKFSISYNANSNATSICSSKNQDDQICGHIKRLAHELNGWPQNGDDTCCRFCKAEQ